MWAGDREESEDTGSVATGEVVATMVPPVVSPEVPLAQGIPVTEDGGPQPETPGEPGPGTLPAAKLCARALRQGCYRLSFRPTSSLASFEGTLRVDRSAPDGGPDNVIVSGDLYRRSQMLPPMQGFVAAPETVAAEVQTASVAAVASAPGSGSAAAKPVAQIPVFPRNRYHSYLRVTGVSVPSVVRPGQPCALTMVAQQYDYAHPPVGSFKGSFPATASRTVTLRLNQTPAPPPLGGPNFVGRWFEGGVDKGAVTLSWLSRFFRRATVEIDTLVDAVPPQPVPDGLGGMEFFDTIYARHGWQVTVVKDETDVPVPAGVDPKACWTSGNLHMLMVSRRRPTTNLDTDWPVHLIVVPAKLGCSRGVMYDQIDVPREGCASFSDDGYPDSDSSNFGSAANKRQRDVLRAYLRSATHEITHTFNQIHQEQETVPDNSIMTTTPSVADVLGGPTTGQPGVFPDQINLAVNTTVRHHLVHMPDPVIRPGGWPFGSWFGTSVPEATDRQRFDHSELDVTVTLQGGRPVVGQPFDVAWTLTNRSSAALIAPNDVSLEGQFASLTITDAEGRTRPFRPFVILCDHVKLAELAPGKALSSSHRVFWSSAGFAFPAPGLYRLAVAVTWSAQGVPVSAEGATEVFVDFPVSDSDNRAAGLVMNSEVGKWVALGGDAYHLTEATRRLGELSDQVLSDEQPRLLAGFAGLLPDPARMGDSPGA